MQSEYHLNKSTLHSLKKKVFRISLYNMFPYPSYRVLKIAEGNAETPVESVVSEDPLDKVIFFVKLAEEQPHRTRRIPPERLPSNHRQSEWEKIILKSHCCVVYFLCKGKRDWVGFPVFLVLYMFYYVIYILQNVMCWCMMKIQYHEEDMYMNIFSRGTQDERVTNEQNKIYREIYVLIFLICLGSVVYKYITLGFEIENVATEFIIFLVGRIYYSFRSTQKGLFSSEVEMHDTKSRWSYQTKNVVFGIAFGVLIGLFFGFHSAFQYADSKMEAIGYFFLVFGVSMMMYIPVLVIGSVISYSIAKKRSDKAMERQLEDDE